MSLTMSEGERKRKRTRESIACIRYLNSKECADFVKREVDMMASDSGFMRFSDASTDLSKGGKGKTVFSGEI
jgi:hypothetical protein